MKRAIVLAIAVHIFIVASIASATDIPAGTLTEDTTWGIAGSPYVVQGSAGITLDDDVTLTIEPGVIVSFPSSNSGIRLDGLGAELVSVGTAENPIILKATNDAEVSYWGGIVGAISNTINLQHTEIRSALIGIQSGFGLALTIEHCLIDATQIPVLLPISVGIKLSGPTGSTPSINTNTIVGVGTGIEISNASCCGGLLLANNLITNNDIGIKYVVGFDGTLRNNSIYNNTQFDIVTQYDIDARFNYWGESTTQEMIASGADANISTLCDSRDVGENCDGIILYENWLLEPDPGTPDGSGIPTPNVPPTANAGEDIVADAAEAITLDGSGSFDPDGAIISYAWKRLPSGEIIGSSSQVQVFATGQAEELFELTVVDNEVDISVDTVKIINSTVAQCLAVIECPGDANEDGSVGMDDLLLVIGNWNNNGGSGDVNGDGSVNGVDLAIVTAAWGPCGGPAETPSAEAQEMINEHLNIVLGCNRICSVLSPFAVTR